MENKHICWILYQNIIAVLMVFQGVETVFLKHPNGFYV